MYSCTLLFFEAKLVNLKLKPWLQQLLGSLPLAVALPFRQIPDLGKPIGPSLVVMTKSGS